MSFCECVCVPLWVTVQCVCNISMPSLCSVHMAKQLLPQRLAFSAHINQLMFTLSKQLVSVNIQQMPKFTITHRNACVFSVSQTMWVQPAFFSLSSLLSAHSVPRTSFTVVIYTDNTLLHIIFDFSTIKGACVQIWGDVWHSDLHVCVCVHVSLSFT